MRFFNNLKKKEKKKAVVVGLDGVPYSLLQNLKYCGHIPNMANIFRNGYFGKMSVCIPEISSVSWTSFMTGKQSGEHGIYGFIDLVPGTYNLIFPNFNYLKVPAIWDDLNELGKKSVVINMPSTYPAREINGVLVSGFIATDINKAVYPPTLIKKLKDIGYRIDVDTIRGRKDPEYLISDLEATLSARVKIFDYIWQEFDWDLYIIVITGTDRLMHFLWDAIEDPTHIYHQAFLEYYEKVDRAVGHIYNRFMELEGSGKGNNQFFMLSDHGFTRIKTEVYLNRWLHENGYLFYQKKDPETIMDIGPESKAFAMDPSRIHINLKNKYPLGIVSQSDYDKIRNELIEGLSDLTYDEDSKIIKRIYKKEELYEGPYLNQAPDLVLLSQHGYDLKGKVNTGEVFGRSGLKGMHTQDDAFYFCSNGGPCNTIFEIKRKIMKCF